MLCYVMLCHCCSCAKIQTGCQCKAWSPGYPPRSLCMVLKNSQQYKNIFTFPLVGHFIHESMVGNMKILPTTESATVCFSSGFVFTWKWRFDHLNHSVCMKVFILVKCSIFHIFLKLKILAWYQMGSCQQNIR